MPALPPELHPGVRHMLLIHPAVLIDVSDDIWINKSELNKKSVVSLCLQVFRCWTLWMHRVGTLLQTVSVPTRQNQFYYSNFQEEISVITCIKPNDIGRCYLSWVVFKPPEKNQHQLKCMLYSEYFHRFTLSDFSDMELKLFYQTRQTPLSFHNKFADFAYLSYCNQLPVFCPEVIFVVSATSH